MYTKTLLLASLGLAESTFPGTCLSTCGINNTANDAYMGDFGIQHPTFAAALSGKNNAALSYLSTVAGGANNTAAFFWATISGGEHNYAYQASTVGGGLRNKATDYAVIGGGQDNSAGGGTTIAGGSENSADKGGSIGGGNKNKVSGSFGAVAGGQENTASGAYATVSGGKGNSASGDYSVVMGSNSEASGYGAIAIGATAKATDNLSGVISFESFSSCKSVGENSLNICASKGLFVNGKQVSVEKGPGLEATQATQKRLADLEAENKELKVRLGALEELVRTKLG